MYIIKWKYKDTDKIYNGSPIQDQQIAQEWCDYENKKHPGLSHWIEEVIEKEE